MLPLAAPEQAVGALRARDNQVEGRELAGVHLALLRGGVSLFEIGQPLLRRRQAGAGRGLGRAYAELLASKGAKVVVNDIGVALDGSGSDAGPAQEVVNEIKKKGGVAIASNRYEIRRLPLDSAIATSSFATWI